MSLKAQTSQTHHSPWEKWPTSSQGPYVPNRTLQLVRERFQIRDKQRSSWSKTDQQVFLITEISDKGKVLFDGYVTERQLSKRLTSSHSRPALRVFSGCSDKLRPTMDSSYMRKFLYDSNTPAIAAVALRATYPSGFGSHLERRPEGTINHMWVRTNFQWAADETEVQLWRKPHSDRLISLIAAFDGISIYSGIYVAYRSWDSSTTVLVVGLTTPHYELTEAFKAMLPGEHGAMTPFIMLRAYLSTVIDCAKETSDLWRKNDGRFVEAALNPDLSDVVKVRNAEKRNRFATYGKNGVLSLQCALVELRSYYRTLSKSETWPKPFGLNMVSSLNQMLQSTEEMKLALETILQTSERQLEVLLGYASLRAGIEMRDLTSATTQMAKDSRRDNEIMKTITVVTMIYLPATFVATLMSMGVFDFYFPDGTSSVAGLRISPEGWVYAAITLPLTLITFVLAWLWMRWTERKAKLQDNAVSI